MRMHVRVRTRIPAHVGCIKLRILRYLPRWSGGNKSFAMRCAS